MSVKCGSHLVDSCEDFIGPFINDLCNKNIPFSVKSAKYVQDETSSAHKVLNQLIDMKKGVVFITDIAGTEEPLFMELRLFSLQHNVTVVMNLTGDRKSSEIVPHVSFLAKFFYFNDADDENAHQLTHSRLSDSPKNVLLVGSGGREHAIAHSLVKSQKVRNLFIAPGNFGTLMESDKCQNVPIDSENIDALVAFAVGNAVDLVVVGPEQPLVLGITDRMNDMGIKCFGPTKAASEAEASKAWSKAFMSRHDIPTARFNSFTDFPSAEGYIQSIDYPVVVKASGLAAGKGVLIPTSKDEAIAGAKSMLTDKEFGIAGSEVVIEEMLEGEEISLLAFCDGTTAVCMPPAQDHKRALDGDQGLNTGGMGAYAPTPLITPDELKQCCDLVQRSVSALAAEDKPFIGVLYAGFIITKNGPMVLEYNCRFGDPETQVLLPLLKSDLFEVMMACAERKLSPDLVKWHRPGSKGGVACTVVCAAPGYPSSYPKGLPISGLEHAGELPRVKVFHAGTKAAPDFSDRAVTSGGRVLAVTGTGATLQEAVDTAYKGVKAIEFERMHVRTDIAQRGLRCQNKLRVGVIGSTRGTDLIPILASMSPPTDGTKTAAGGLSLHDSAEVVFVLSNKSKAGILEKAKDAGIPYKFIGAAGKSREEYDREVIAEMDAAGVDLVLLIGYMRIVSKDFTDHFHGRCLNVHPSLLPEFAGGMDTDVHAAVIAAKKDRTGCTVHFVTEEVDGGPILVQKACQVEYPQETPESLKTKVQALEGEALVEAIHMVLTGRAAEIFEVQTMFKQTMTYQDAGVDISAGDALVRAIKPFCRRTRRPGCDAELGGFGGLFNLSQAGCSLDKNALNSGGNDPNDVVLVSGTDGVGTKLMIAQALGKHDTIGIDLVAMCVNDILVCGAEPLFFLDYYATGKLNVVTAAEVVKGIAVGCEESGAALIGGETAEMAGMYEEDEYDLAGFCVGAVRRKDILPQIDVNSEAILSEGVSAGDVLIALPSSGVHSNGYSLVRKCVERSGLSWREPAPYHTGETPMSLGDSLLTPTRIYVKELKPLIAQGLIKAMAHITGGGLLDNLPRVLPVEVAAVVDIGKSGWKLPPVFQWLRKVAQLPQEEMLRTFNCGVGMVLIVKDENVDGVLEQLRPFYKGLNGFELIQPFRLGCISKRGKKENGELAEQVIVDGMF